MEPESQGVEETQNAGQHEETPRVEAPTTTEQQPTIAEDELPTEPDKQKEAFIKMRQELKEKNDLLKQYQQPTEDEFNVINQFRQGTFAAPESPLNPETGLDEFTNRVTQAEQIAYSANQRISQLEQQLEDQKLYAEFPELNPMSEDSRKPESKAFEEFVAGKAALEIMKGKKPDLVSIARKAKEAFGGLTAAQKEAITQEVTQTIQNKENATLEARGTSFVAPKAEDLSDLTRKVNRGDMDALTELLKKRG